MADKIDFDPDVWAGLPSDKERWESLGCNEKQLRAINVLFNYPAISPSTLKERRRLSGLDKDEEANNGGNT
jgi:hypothetical protein